MKLAEIFDCVARQMSADFESTRAALTHPGLKGGAFEESFRAFLRKYLPPKLSVTQGILVDSFGNSSKQLDVIVTDAQNTPIFYESGDTRVVPVETAYAVIEVKANLTVNELNRCICNMQSVRALQKIAFQPGSSAPVVMYGKEFSAWPVNYYVFAIDSAPLEALSSHMVEIYTTQQLPPERRIDTTCILNRGLILNWLASDQFDVLPRPDSRIGRLHTKRSLLLFYALTSLYWFQAHMPIFNIIPYLQNMNFGADED